MEGSYLFFLIDGVNNRAVADAGEVVFDGEIVGVLLDQPHTRHDTISGNTFYSSNFQYGFRGSGGNNDKNDNDGGRGIEGNSTTNSQWQNFYNSYKSSLSSTITDANGVDWISVSDYGSGTNNRIQFRPFLASREAFFRCSVMVENDSEFIIRKNLFFKRLNNLF